MNKLLIGDSTDVLNKINDKFQMIYIDPPYNTNRNDLAYDDNRTNDEFISLLNETFSKSYYLLNETGSIFISIPGETVHIIRNVCDNIYGEKNYQGTIIRVENAKKQKIGKPSLKENYEYIVVYSKNINKTKLYEIENNNYLEYQKQIVKLKNIINSNHYINDYLELKISFEEISMPILKILKSIWTIQELNQGLKQYKYLNNDNKLIRAADINMYLGCGKNYKMIHPITNNICKTPKYAYPIISKLIDWELNENELNFKGTIKYLSNSKILCGNIILNLDENKIPDYANELDCLMFPDTIINITGSDDRYLTKIFENNKVFEYPKPLALLEYLLKIGSKENDNVLDFFGGSGSTAEACNNLNRSFTLIQRKEKLKANIELSNKTLEYVSDITIERLKRTNVDFEIIEY